MSIISIDLGNIDNTLTLGDSNYFIFGTDGNNTLSIGNGDDTLALGDGNNTVTLGGGTDHIAAGKGNNTITISGLGASTVTLTDGNNTITVADGHTVIVAGDGLNIVTVGDGNASITLGNGFDQVTTGDGNSDIIVGNGAGDTVFVGMGSNKIALGTGSANIVHTGSGNNSVSISAAAVSGASILGALTSGNGGNNRLVLTSTGIIDAAGVSGFQIYQLDDGGANSLSLSNANFARLPGGSITVLGGDSGNTIDASALSAANAVILSAGSGSDLLIGGAANDTLQGGLGSDVLDGGAGINTAVFSGAAAGYTVTNNGGTVSVNGADGHDTLTHIQFLQFADGVVAVPSLSGTPSLAIAATAASRAEGNSGATPFTFAVTRGGNISGTTTVVWSATGLSPNPVNAADFAGGIVPSGTLTFAPGVLTQTITVNIAGDTAAEADEHFRVVLSAPGNGAITTASASATVFNDDTSLAIASITGSRPEGDSGSTPFLFTVTRSGLTNAAGTVEWYTNGPGPGLASVGPNDFVGGVIPSGTLSFAPGQTSQVITVDIQGDTALEPDEFFAVGLRNASGATITTATALARIVNDETVFAIAPTNAVQSEGNSGATAFTFTVSRTGNIAGTHTIAWGLTGAASGASANAADFAGGQVPTGVLTFAPGVTSRTITVNVRGDSTVEPDEGFRVVLSSASSGAAITTQIASGTIVNDDTGFSIVSTTGSHAEGNSGVTPFIFTVTRTGVLTGSNTVAWYATGPAAGSGLASVGPNDFVGGAVPAGGTLSFAAGVATQSVTVDIQGDTLQEADEYFLIGLRNPTGGAAVIVPTALAKVVNDDTAFSIAGTDAVKAEGNSGSTPFTFTVTRSGNIAGTHSIAWLVSGQQPNSVGGADFVSGSPLSGGLLFAPGEVAKTITVQVHGDTLVEPNEHFVVLLRNASAGAAITVNNASGTILNDDSAPGPDSAAPPLASADFTGDGVADTLRLGASGDLFLLDGATGVQSAISQSAAGLSFVAASDLNADGRADLLLQSANGGLYDWTMNGATVQHADLITTLPIGTTVAQAAGGDILLHAAAGASAWMLLQMNGGSVASSTAYDLRPAL